MDGTKEWVPSEDGRKHGINLSATFQTLVEVHLPFVSVSAEESEDFGSPKAELGRVIILVSLQLRWLTLGISFRKAKDRALLEVEASRRPVETASRGSQGVDTWKTASLGMVEQEAMLVQAVMTQPRC